MGPYPKLFAISIHAGAGQWNSTLIVVGLFNDSMPTVRVKCDLLPRQDNLQIYENSVQENIDSTATTLSGWLEDTQPWKVHDL
jgi:hypothetical protein